MVQSEDPKVFAQRRVQVLGLAACQYGLRLHLERFQAENNLRNIKDTAMLLELEDSKHLSRFVRKERVMCSGRTFEALTKALNLEILAMQIKNLASGLPTREMGLSQFSAEIIDLVYDLKEFSQSKLNQGVAEFFKPYHKLIGGILRCSREDIRRIEDPNTFTEIRSFVDKVMRGELIAADSVSDEATKLSDMYKILLKHFVNQAGVGKALHIRSSTVGQAVRGVASKKDFKKVFHRCGEVIKGLDVTGAQKFVSDGGVPENPSKGNFDGETSPQGVKFVLGPKSFRQLEIEVSQINKLIDLIKEAMENCRRLLNLASQIVDEKTKMAIRKSVLGKEVEELELAMRLFSQKYPNELLKLNAGQREFWATIRKEDQ